MAEDIASLRSERPRSQWDALLQELEAETALLAEAQREGRTPAPLGSWQPPVIGSLPDEFADRVRALIGRQHALQREFEADLQDAPPHTRMPVHRPNAPEALLIDKRA